MADDSEKQTSETQIPPVLEGGEGNLAKAENSGTATRKYVLLGVMLLLGFGLGISGLMMVQHIGEQVRFHGLMAIVSAMAALLILAAIFVAIFKWLWRSRGAGVFSRLWEAVSTVFSKPLQRTWADHTATTWREHGPILWGAFLTTLAFWAGLSLLHPIVGGLFSFASYLSSQAQVEVMDAQNRIVAIDQEFQQANAYAEQKYQQIATILINPDSSAGEQIFALRELPEAMRITVPRAIYNPHIPGGVQQTYSLPNLESLRGVLRLYMRMDRVSVTLKRAGIHFSADEPLSDAAMIALESLEEISNELLVTLHRLGPQVRYRLQESSTDVEDASKSITLSGECLWTWMPSTNESLSGKRVLAVAEVKDRSLIPSPRHSPHDKGSDVQPTLDLAHIGSDLDQLCAPFAFRTNYKLFSKPEYEENDAENQIAPLSMRSAHLQGSDLNYISLRGADLSDAQLQSATANDLQGADLSFARLFNANLMHCNLQASYLDGASMGGARLNWSKLNGASLSGAELQGARLDHAVLHGTDLSGSDLRGADLSEAELIGANFTGADLAGADLRGTKLHGVIFEDANLDGTNFSRALFGAGTFALETKEIPGAFQYAFFFHEPDNKLHPNVFLPGAIMPEAWKSGEAVYVTGISGNDLLKELERLKPSGAEVGDEEREKLGWLKFISKETLSRLPWPLKSENILRTAAGEKSITRETRSLNIYSACFHSTEGGAWMKNEIRDELLAAVESDSILTPSEIIELKQKLKDVECPEKFGSEDKWNDKLREVLNARSKFLRQLAPPPPPPPQ